MMRKLFLLLGFSLLFPALHAESGYELWLRYLPIENEVYAANCREQVKEIGISGSSATMDIIRNELRMGLGGLLKIDFNPESYTSEYQSLVIAKPEDLDKLLPRKYRSGLSALPDEA